MRTVQWNLHHQLLRSDVLITGSSSAGECHCAIVPSRASVTGEAAKRPNSGIDEYWWGVPPMNIEDNNNNQENVTETVRIFKRNYQPDPYFKYRRRKRRSERG